MRTLQYLQKKINLFFAHENIKKRASKVAHNRPQTFFFHKYGPAAQTSPELIFHIIKCREQASVLLSVVLCNQKGMDPIVHYVPTRGNIIAGRLHFKNF